MGCGRVPDQNVFLLWGGMQQKMSEYTSAIKQFVPLQADTILELWEL